MILAGVLAVVVVMEGTLTIVVDVILAIVVPFEVLSLTIV